MYLDEMSPICHAVAWGEVGLHGALGWDGLPVSVSGQRFEHSVSAHAPSSLIYYLDGSFDLFASRVAIADSGFGPGQYPTVTFQAVVDGVVAATVSNVHDSRARPLIANVQGAKQLELRVTCPTFEHCHSVWLDPHLTAWPADGLLDPLCQVRIDRPDKPCISERCIVTMTSPGFARWLDIFLNSLKANGGCKDAGIVVFRVDEDPECDAVIADHGAYTVPCTSLVPRSSTIRPAVFTVGAVTRCAQMIVAEADMIVLKDISCLWDAIAVCADPVIFTAREHHRNVPYRLEEFFMNVFEGRPDELLRLGATPQERDFDLQVNAGILAGSSEAIAALDAAMRELLPFSRQWVQSRRDQPYRELFVINLALARINCAARMLPAYNVQLFMGNEREVPDRFPPEFEFRGEPVKVLHFSARKQDYAALQSLYWNRGNSDRQLAAGLDELRQAPLKSLRDAGFLAGLIRRIGLQHVDEPAAAEIYGDDVRWMNDGPGLFQIPQQLAEALVWLSSKRIRSYAEVGVLHGWTFAFVTVYLSRFKPLDKSVAIDVKRLFTSYCYLREHYPVSVHWGDSSAFAGQKFDLVFIDAHHGYSFAKEDWSRLGAHAKFCMFHDVNDTAVQREHGDDSVVRLWQELKADRFTAEFLGHQTGANSMGIGILCTADTP